VLRALAVQKACKMSFPTFKVKSVATEEEANLTAKYELMRRKKARRRRCEGGGSPCLDTDIARARPRLSLVLRRRRSVCVC